MQTKLILGITLLTIFLACSFLQPVNAIPTVKLGKLVTGSVLNKNPNIITIDLSPVCLAYVKQNHTSICPSYKTLYKFDNSNEMLSGKFVTTNGFFHRKATATTLDYMMYPPGKTIIMVDPNYNALAHSKEIIIVPPGFKYTNQFDNATNGFRIEYHDRYVENCKTVKMVYLNDSYLLDTINYLDSGCKTTKYDDKVKIPLSTHQTDPKNTQAYLTKQWFTDAKKIYTQNCIIHKCDTKSLDKNKNY